MAEMTSMAMEDILRNVGDIFVSCLKYLYNNHEHVQVNGGRVDSTATKIVL